MRISLDSGCSRAGRHMRRVLYRIAASVDGYIAGPRGEVDWIVHDPAVDFAKVYESVDTVLLGRRTYELTRQPGAPAWPRGWQIYVFSRTLAPEDHPDVTVVRGDAGAHVAGLRAAPGREIWLFGGGSLFRSLLGPSRWMSWRSRSCRFCSGAASHSWRREHR
jgi:dihydrofolate reductase